MRNIEKFERFIISQKGLLIRNGKALIMEMTKNPGYWDLPGGRIDKQEDGIIAFKREILEETGIDDFANLGVAHYHSWYLSDGLGVCGVINLIYNKESNIDISPEHLSLAWIGEEEIDNYNYFWSEMHTMIKKGFEKYKLLKQ